MLHRRTVPKAMAGAGATVAGGLATPAISQRAAALDESRHAEPPGSKSMMTACQTLAQSP